jgi:hypothetical protein
MGKQSHRLWSKEQDSNGNVIIKRSSPERDDWSEEDLEYARSASQSIWGLFGASLVDDNMFKNDLSRSLINHLNRSASVLRSQKVKLPKIPTWRELRARHGSDLIDEVRDSVSMGIKARQASLFLNIPLIMAYDIVDGYKSFDKKALKEVLDSIKSEGPEASYDKFGKVAGELTQLLDEYSQTGLHKMAVDDQAKDYWLSYLGPYAEELVRDVRRRVRADMASQWLRKQSVDESAREYWENYYGAYGTSLVQGDVSKKRL